MFSNPTTRIKIVYKDVLLCPTTEISLYIDSHNNKNIIDKIRNNMLQNRLLEFKGDRTSILEVVEYLVRLWIFQPKFLLKNTRPFNSCPEYEYTFDNLVYKTIEDLKFHLFSKEGVMVVISMMIVGQCDGCINGSCGQRSHMECPRGCLHEPSECKVCNI